MFNLPFGMIAQADFNRSIANPPEENAQLDFNMPHFDQLRGGLQIKAMPPASTKPDKFSASFKGWTFQLDNIRWSHSRAAAVWLDARRDRSGSLQSEVPTSAVWRRSDGAARAHGVLGIRRVDLQQLISTRRRPSPTSARFNSTSSSAGLATRSCRSAASSIRSACTSSGRSR